MNSEMFERWFRVADEDRDGVVSGGEAVKFFQRSGLSQERLGQIWELSSGGQASLNQFQFSTAMRLVALAQANHGHLPPDQSRLVVMGGGPNLGLPTMQGLHQGAYPTGALGPSPQITGQSYAPQVTGQSYAPQTTGQLYTAQVTGARPSYVPQSTGVSQGYTPQVTGGVAPTYVPQKTGFMASPLPFPPITPTELQKYQGMFKALDKDLDGIVQGGDCFTYFMAWGLDKTVLRDIWHVVAGNAGKLNDHQFTQCVYLMDCAKRGIPVPSVLPPGPFPAVVASAAGAPPLQVTGGAPASAASSAPSNASWSLHSQFGDAGMTGAVAAATSGSVALPSLPPRAEYVPDPRSAPIMQSRLPALDPSLSTGLSPADKLRLDAERAAAEAGERALFGAEADGESARRRAELFQKALADVAVFKSRTDVALLQAQEAASRLQAEADALQKRYQQAYAGAEAQYSSGAQIRETVSGLAAAKAEAEERLAGLTAEVAALAAASQPASAAAMEAELRGVQAAIAAAEAQRSALDLQVGSARKQKDLLQRRLSDIQMASEAAHAELAAAKRDVTDLTRQVDAARTSYDAYDIGALLTRAANAYKALFRHAQAAGIEVPYEAQLTHVTALTWTEDMLAGAAEWQDTDDEARGFVVVNAFPDADSAPLQPLSFNDAAGAGGFAKGASSTPSSRRVTGGTSVAAPQAPAAPSSIGPAGAADPFAVLSSELGKPMAASKAALPSFSTFADSAFGSGGTDPFGGSAFGDNAFGAPPAASVPFSAPVAAGGSADGFGDSAF